MKKPLKYLSTIAFAFVVSGVFSVSFVNATTIYQQLTDSSGDFSLTANIDTNVVGSFIPIVDVSFNPGGDAILYFFVTVPSGGSSEALTFYVSSTTGSGAQDLTFLTTNTFPADDNTYASSTGTNIATSVILQAGVTYYIKVLSSLGTPHAKLTTNLSKNFFFGYLTDDGLESVPLVPGIPGFTDVGISTTSQQVYCNQNFSTSTGFLDSLGQSISLGFCNVGVFLFVPNPAVVSQFQQLPSLFTKKFPFSWYLDIKSSLSSLTASSTANYPNVSYNLGASVAAIIPSGNVSLASTTNIQALAPDSTWTFLRLLMSFMLWILFAYFVYGTIQSIWHKSTQ